MGVLGVTPKGIGDPTLLPPHDADTPGAYKGGAPNNNKDNVVISVTTNRVDTSYLRDTTYPFRRLGAPILREQPAPREP